MPISAKQEDSRIQSQHTFFFTDMEQGMKHSSVFYLFKVDINALVLNLKLHFGQVLKESSKFSNYRVKAAIYKGFPIQTKDFVA